MSVFDSMKPDEVLAFVEVLVSCVENKDLLAEYDRLRGTNLLLRGTPIAVEIDFATGRISEELRDFAHFVKDAVWDRLPLS